MSRDAGAVSRDESSGSMANPPPYRITLAQWLALIAVDAFCLAKVSPVLLPMILLPMAMVGFFPRQTTRFAMETSAAVGWLLGLAESFSGLRIDIGAVMLLGAAGVFLAVQWTIRRARAQAIGRKNDLFVGSDRGGRTAATLYSLVRSCKRHEVDPFAYLKNVLERQPSHPADRLGELLPDAWVAAHAQARRKVAS